MMRTRRRPEHSASPAADAASPPATMAERVVAATSSVLSGRESRRRFLTKAAVVGSALAVNPFDFILKPGTAYGALCGTCGDGWTAFCCTINGGRNTCPPGSFVAGWWKADNAAYCCGAARYILDCNATCPTQCSCRCSGASCDGRRTCCNQFRYGQCHQEISCYGPVVCRVATCTPAWRYDSSCTTTSATDNRTVSHGAPCLPGCNPPPPPSAIASKYQSLGGPNGFLGPVYLSERAAPGGRGRYEIYTAGRIYWTSATGAWEVHGSILNLWAQYGASTSPHGYPTSDVSTTGDGRARYSNFERGRIYRWAQGTFEVHGAIFDKFRALGSATGSPLGYPTSNEQASLDGRSLYSNFEHGRIYVRYGAPTVEIHGAVFAKHEALGGVQGAYGYPTTDERRTSDGRAVYSDFERGRIYASFAVGVAAIDGGIFYKHVSMGGSASFLGLPTADARDVGDGRGRVATFEGGRIYSSNRGSFEVHGALLDRLLADGDVQGSLGYPITDTYSESGLRHQRFEGGRLSYNPLTGTVTRD
jgi:hypothetical protein